MSGTDGAVQCGRDRDGFDVSMVLREQPDGWPDEQCADIERCDGRECRYLQRGDHGRVRYSEYELCDTDCKCDHVGVDTAERSDGVSGTDGAVQCGRDGDGLDVSMVLREQPDARANKQCADVERCDGGE